MQYLPIPLIIAVLAGSYWLGYTPLLIPALYALASLLTLLAYAKDKAAAAVAAWRTSEFSLHMMALLGGWPGAVLAQQWLRHKTQKTSFRITFWITVLVNCAALGWLHTAEGAIYLNTFLFKLEAAAMNNTINSSVRAGLLTLLGFHA